MAPGEEVAILGVDIKPIGADTVWIIAVFLLVFLSLRNQILRFIVWIPADPVQEGKAITHGDTNIGAKLKSRSAQ